MCVWCKRLIKYNAWVMEMPAHRTETALLGTLHKWYIMFACEAWNGNIILLGEVECTDAQRLRGDEVVCLIAGHGVRCCHQAIWIDDRRAAQIAVAVLQVRSNFRWVLYDRSGIFHRTNTDISRLYYRMYQECRCTVIVNMMYDCVYLHIF